MHKGYLKTATLLGALSVALGAFAAHSLKEAVSPDVLMIFETGVRYQFYHVFALLAVAILYKEFPVKAILWAGKLFIAGIILFSGSLYLLTFLKGSGIENMNWVGAITPFGGLCFISGWISLLGGFSKK